MRDLDRKDWKGQDSQQYYRASKIRNFKRGDNVLILHKVKSNSGGWENKWVDDMDDYVDKIGTVLRVDHHKGVHVVVDGLFGHYAFPHFILRKIND